MGAVTSFFLLLTAVMGVVMLLIIFASYGSMLFDFNRLSYLSKQANKEPISFTRNSLWIVCLGAFFPGVSVLLSPEWAAWNIVATALFGAVGAFLVEQASIYWRKGADRRNPFLSFQSTIFGFFGVTLVFMSFWPVWRLFDTSA